MKKVISSEHHSKPYLIIQFSSSVHKESIITDGVVKILSIHCIMCEEFLTINQGSHQLYKSMQSYLQTCKKAYYIVTCKTQSLNKVLNNILFSMNTIKHFVF